MTRTQFLRLSSKLIAFALLLLALFGAKAVAADEGPRPGKYLIQSYGAVGQPPLFLGSFILSGNSYKSLLPGDKPAGEGTYRYDAGAKKVTWLTGPFAGQYEGDFTIEREGKTHKIRLKRTTVATNSTDSK
jgi:hypothetical protein